MKLIQIVGLPCSGKTEYANKIKTDNMQILSLEEYIKERHLETERRQAEEELEERCRKLLLNGVDVIYDNAGLSSNRRRNFLNSLPKECNKECRFIYVPYRFLFKRNLRYQNLLPDEIFWNAVKNIDIPEYFEGWDTIQLIAGESFQAYNLEQFLSEKDSYNQGNEHHQYTLGEHLRECRNQIPKDHPRYEMLCDAAALHDCGKPLTKGYFNRAGERDGNIHYYGHDSAGGYLSLEFLWTKYPADKALYIAGLINYHMYPYTWMNEQNQKKEELWGIQFYEDILTLHEADKKAH